MIDSQLTILVMNFDAEVSHRIQPVVCIDGEERLLASFYIDLQ
jgi:hypothetical protein